MNNEWTMHEASRSIREMAMVHGVGRRGCSRTRSQMQMHRAQGPRARTTAIERESNQHSNTGRSAGRPSAQPLHDALLGSMHRKVDRQRETDESSSDIVLRSRRNAEHNGRKRRSVREGEMVTKPIRRTSTRPRDPPRPPRPMAPRSQKTVSTKTVRPQANEMNGQTQTTV